MTRSGKSPVISITSGKGGVGKTLIACNLATILAGQGRKILVADCDLGLANIDIMLGLRPRRNLKDVIYGDADIRDIVVPTKGGFDLIPASSGVREMAQLILERIDVIKAKIRSLRNYDLILLDTGAGISEVVLQFNLLADRNIVVINRELTSLTDAYAMIKTMYQVFDRDSLDIIVNSAAGEEEGREIFGRISSICKKFLNVRLTYLGHVLQDPVIPKSILKQEIAVLASPRSKIAANFAQIARALPLK
ncbi:MAG TPA: MinD/ParA family protein [Syntrophales bacterium]|nr:MinD/ParA family protein [Syntrophales bacterium]